MWDIVRHIMLLRIKWIGHFERMGRENTEFRARINNRERES
jgi:hypothetical protein